MKNKVYLPNANPSARIVLYGTFSEKFHLQGDVLIAIKKIP